jgi:hypothetical protein
MAEFSETKHFRKFTAGVQQLVVYSGILTALAYLFGRSYYKGYFGELGIDTSFIQMSIFDIVEQGWGFLWSVGLAILLFIVYAFLFLAVYNLFEPLIDKFAKNHKKPILISLLFIFVAWIIFLNRDALLAFIYGLSLTVKIVLAVSICLLILALFLSRKRIRKMFSEWVSELRANPMLLDKVDKFFEISTDTIFQAGLAIILLFFVLLYSIQAEKSGSTAGSLYLKEKVSFVEMVTSVQITSNSCAVADVFVQNDWQFLYFNNGHYFLAKLDSNSKPQDSLVVDGANVISMRTLHTTPTVICPPINP